MYVILAQSGQQTKSGTTTNTASDNINGRPSRPQIPLAPSTSNPIPGGVERSDDDVFACPDCTRSFGTKTGMGVYRPDSFAAANERVEKKKSWSQEEMQRVSGMEAELEGRGIRFMNVELQKRHSCRTVDFIKGLRKKPVYQEFVELARIALRGVESSIIVELPIFPDHSDSDLVRAISEMTVRPQLTSKNESLAMVAAADKATTLALLGNYLRDVFPPKLTGNGRRRTSNNPPLPRNSHQRRRTSKEVS